jgi:hypothetical protein
MKVLGSGSQLLQISGQFAKAELANHRYVMVLHTHRANPQVHLPDASVALSPARSVGRDEFAPRFAHGLAERYALRDLTWPAAFRAERSPAR